MIVLLVHCDLLFDAALIDDGEICAKVSLFQSAKRQNSSIDWQLDQIDSVVRRLSFANCI